MLGDTTKKLRILFDVQTQTFKQGLSSLKADLAAADGFAAKSKVGWQNLSQQLAVYGPQAAMAAGAAVVAFGKKAVDSFTTGALEAGKMADATGMTAEEASRLAEVAKDVGVSIDTLSGAIRKNNAAADSGALEDYGIAIARTKDGAYDATNTFLNTVTALGKMTDASARETAAKKLLGRSWAELAELTTMSASEMKAALDAVSDAQVFDAEEVAKARRYREQMDELGDVFEQLALTIGEDLTPMVGDFAEALADTTEAIGALSKAAETINRIGPDGWLGGLAKSAMEAVNPITDLLAKFSDALDVFEEIDRDGFKTLFEFKPANKELTGTAQALSEVAAEQDHAADAAEYYTSRMNAQRTATHQVTDSTNRYGRHIQDLIDRLEAVRRAEEDLRNERRTAADGARRAEASIDAYQDSLAELEATQASGTASAEDLESANRAAADAAIQAASDFATQEGAALDSKEGTDRFKESLGYLASTLAPGSEVRRQLEAYLQKLQEIPRDIRTVVTVTEFDPTGAGNTVRRLPISGNPNLAGVIGSGGAGESLAVQPASAAWQQALQVWGAVSSAVSSVADTVAGPTKGQRFDREFERLRRRYELGDFTADEYLRLLQALRQKYPFHRTSDRAMALWREIQKAKADVKEAAAEAAAANQGGSLQVKDPFTMDPPAAKPTKNRMGTVGGSGSAGSGQVHFHLHQNPAVMLSTADRASLRRAWQQMMPDFVEMLTRYRNGG